MYPTYPYQPFQPQYQMPQPTQKPYDALIRVTGMDGARAYQMPPNSTAVLFDGGDDIMYVKSSDAAGFPTIRQFRFTPIEDKPAVKEVELSPDLYVTRKEFEELKELVRNGKQFVRNKPNVPQNAEQ